MICSTKTARSSESRWPLDRVAQHLYAGAREMSDGAAGYAGQRHFDSPIQHQRREAEHAEQCDQSDQPPITCFDLPERCHSVTNSKRQHDRSDCDTQAGADKDRHGAGDDPGDRRRRSEGCHAERQLRVRERPGGSALVIAYPCPPIRKTVVTWMMSRAAVAKRPSMALQVAGELPVVRDLRHSADSNAI